MQARMAPRSIVDLNAATAMVCFAWLGSGEGEGRVTGDAQVGGTLISASIADEGRTENQAW